MEAYIITLNPPSYRRAWLQLDWQRRKPPDGMTLSLLRRDCPCDETGDSAVEAAAQRINSRRAHRQCISSLFGDLWDDPTFSRQV